jgi:predicted nucleic-acid-binding Zn-ribbon protein
MTQAGTPLPPEAVKLVTRALQELEKRNAKNDYCPRCSTSDWNVDPVAIAAIPLQGIPAAPPGSYFPSRITVLQIVCKNCGYTMFHNLNTLGLASSESS